MVRLISALFFSLSAGACAPGGAASEPRDTGASPVNPGGQAASQESDWKAVEKLETDAKAIVKVEGCGASAECATAPVGRKACGSPRYYLTYCSKTTDTAALRAKLDEVVKAETAYNQKYSMMSTCEMRMPPEVEAAAGACREKK
jgi:hypothetical protein